MGEPKSCLPILDVMFQEGFKFTKINHSQNPSPPPIVTYNYAFRGKTGKRYLVIVEQYDFYVYIIKFCLQERKVHPDRFNILTGLNECSRILTTIGAIMKDFYNKNPYVSFGFLGSPLPGEKANNTKRFRAYARVVSQMISPVDFEHRPSPKHSAYLLLNIHNSEPDLFAKVTQMFNQIYPIQESFGVDQTS